jgi:hypothetical protein
MTAIDTRPEFTDNDVLQYLNELFGIVNATIKPLPSYVDQNYYVSTPQGEECVFKISNMQEDKDLLTLQNNALLHLEKKGVHAPRLIVRNSVSIFSVPDRVHSGQCCVRMLSWVKGRVFGDFQPQSLQLMESLGQLLATVDNAFKDFTETRAHRPDFIWAMQNAHLLWKMIDAIDKFSSAERGDIIKSTLRAFEDRALPMLTKHCQAGIIHCDPNDQNILADEAGNNVLALIDYGDVCMSYYVCNIAIAMAYAMLTNIDRYKQVGAAVLRGYRSTLKLNEQEQSLIPLLVKVRLVTSVIVSANSKLSKPDDEYIVISERPAWELLEILYKEEESKILASLLQ